MKSLQKAFHKNLHENQLSLKLVFICLLGLIVAFPKPIRISFISFNKMSIINMIILRISLLIFLAIFSSAQENPYPPIIPYACRATRFPELCETSLTQASLVPTNQTSLQIIQSAVSNSYNNLETGQSMLKYMVDNPDGNINRTEIAKICLDILSLSNYRTKSTLDALMHEELKDARAWMSAALSYQQNCWGGLKNVNNTKVVVDTMSFLMSLTQHSSNALSMIDAYDNYGKDIALWAPPKTERGGFYEKGSGGNSELGFKGGVPSNLKQVVTVCKNQRKCYRTVQEAVNHAPDDTTPEAPYVIKIWKGVYEETVRIPFEKKNVVLLGEGMGKTIITGSLNACLGINTYNTATLGVLGDGFMAKGLTIENTAGADFHQAVAFRSDSDRSMIEDCEIIGNQDTLYVHSLRQFYKKCRIQGNVDFIFGNAAAVFQDCEILFQAQHPNPESFQTNTITAHARCDPAQSTGLVFLNCVISGTEEYLGYYRKNPPAHTNYLGRPWKEYSRTVFINCNIGELICPDGWMPWNGDVGLKTVFYGEFGNSGRGSYVSKRVPWSNQIPPRHVHTYSVQNFIQVDQWIPKSHNAV